MSTQNAEGLVSNRGVGKAAPLLGDAGRRYKSTLPFSWPFIIMGAAVLGLAFDDFRERNAVAGFVMAAISLVLLGLGYGIREYAKVVRDRAVTAVIDQHKEQILTELRAGLSNASEELRLGSFSLLECHIGPELRQGLRPELLHNLAHPNESIRLHAAQNLSRMGWFPTTPDEARHFIPILWNQVKFPEKVERRLKECPDICVAGMVPLLYTFAASHVTDILQKIGAPAVPALIDELETAPQERELQLLSVLGSMGKKARAAAPVLQELIAKKRFHYERDARKALERIR